MLALPSFSVDPHPGPHRFSGLSVTYNHRFVSQSHGGLAFAREAVIGVMATVTVAAVLPGIARFATSALCSRTLVALAVNTVEGACVGLLADGLLKAVNAWDTPAAGIWDTGSDGYLALMRSALFAAGLGALGGAGIGLLRFASARLLPGMASVWRAMSSAKAVPIREEQSIEPLVEEMVSRLRVLGMGNSEIVKCCNWFLRVADDSKVPLADVYRQALALPHPANPSELLAALNLLPGINRQGGAWRTLMTEGWARANESVFSRCETIDISRYVTRLYRPYGHRQVPLQDTLEDTLASVAKEQGCRDVELLARAQARGLRINQDTFATFCGRMRDCDFRLASEQGEEALTYIMQRGKERFIVKQFSEGVYSPRTGEAVYSSGAHAEAAMSDQLRALLEIQDALDFIGEKRARIANIFELGRDYYVREYLPYTNLSICRKRIGELKRIFQNARDTGSHTGFRFLAYLMRVVEEIDVNVGYLKVPHIGRQLVIYDAI